MLYTSDTLERLIEEFTRLPGIGRKTAQRLAFHLMKVSRERVGVLAEALIALKDKVRYCSVCFNLTEGDLCAICSDSKRNRSTICIVEEPSDVIAIEKSKEYNGLYHVLGGTLSPLDGIGPEDLRVKELLTRLDGSVKEVILANNPNVEGEATSLYLYKIINPLGVKVSRIARGLPVGGDLEFADEVTLARALQGRQEMS